MKVGSSNTTFKCKVYKENNKEQMLGDVGVGATKKHMVTDSQDEMMLWLLIMTTCNQPQPASTSSSNLIAAHFNATSGTSAEIIWALNWVVKGYSDRLNDDFSDILRTMYPTRPEAKYFKMGRNKLKYAVNLVCTHTSEKS